MASFTRLIIPRILRSMFLLALAFGPAAAVRAQNQPTLEQFQRQMLEMQRQLMESFQNLPGFGLSPADSASSFFFQLDSLGSGDGSSFFFQFGNPSGSSAVPPDLEEMMREFRDFARGFADPFQMPQRGSQPPADDGALRENGEDDLLPEERLRNGAKTEPRGSETEPPARNIKPKKSRVETIRI